MKVETFSYQLNSGWSVTPFPVLDSDRTLVIVCGASQYVDNPAAIDELSRAFPKSKMIGCSTSGEIFGTRIMDGSLAVAVVKFEYSSVDTCSSPVGSADESYSAGQALASELHTESLRAVIALSDGLMVNGSELVRGFNSVLPPNVVVTGGLAGDGERFEKTWVINDRKPQTGFVSAVGLYGPRVHVGHGSKGGWDIFGPERTVTRAEGNVLYELDGNPALELYKRYLGDRASGLPATALLFPLALRANTDDEKRIVRTILAVDEEAQSMTFAGDIPTGYRAQLMKANFDRLVHGASEAALMTRDVNPSASDMLCLAISCVGRRIVLGERIEEELDAAMEVLPKSTNQIGFYSYGEISPYTTGHCDLHNQTMTLTTISEE